MLTLLVYPPRARGGQRRRAPCSERRGPAPVWEDRRRPVHWLDPARRAPPSPISLAPRHQRFDPRQHWEGLAQRHLETMPLVLHCLRRVALPKVQWDRQARLAPAWPVSVAALHQRFDPGRRSEGRAQRHMEMTRQPRAGGKRRHGTTSQGRAGPGRWERTREGVPPPRPAPQAAFPQCLDPERRSEGLAQRRLETRPPDLHCLPRRVAQPKALNRCAGPPGRQ